MRIKYFAYGSNMLVVAGAEQHDLPREYIERQRSAASVPDPDPDRPARKQAEAILEDLSRSSAG